MLLLDAALRISAITMLLLVALMALLHARHLLQARIAAALCVSLSAMLTNTLPSAMSLSGPARAIIWSLHTPNLALIWLFGLSLYEDNFRMKTIHWAVPIAMFFVLHTVELSIWLGTDALILPGSIANRILGYGALIHLLWRAISGRKDDLVESRRRTRLWFVIGTVISAFLIITGETAHSVVSGANYDPDWLSTLRTAIAWPMILFGTVWFLNLRPEQFLFETAPKPEAKAPEIDPKDAAMHRRLVQVMEDGAFTEPGLTIGALAEKVSVPEHQLRALINKGLGFRNFSSFLNSYRIAFAKQVLSDPERARVPVLTIAMDAGYNSLAPFNRAFKAAEGIPPTVFRNQALKMADQQ